MSYQLDRCGPRLHPVAGGGGLSEGWVQGRVDGGSDKSLARLGLHHRSGRCAQDTPRRPHHPLSGGTSPAAGLRTASVLRGREENAAPRLQREADWLLLLLYKLRPLGSGPRSRVMDVINLPHKERACFGVCQH